MNGNGVAEKQLLDGTVPFTPARTDAVPAFGNPAHWSADLPRSGRPALHNPE